MKKNMIFLVLLFAALRVHSQLPLLSTKGTCFVNSVTGEKIVLKGINVSNNAWGFYEWPISDSLEKAGMNPLIRASELKPFVFTKEDVERLSLLEGNIIRYCFNDVLFRADNPKRYNNIKQMREHICWLEEKGYYTLICMQIYPGLDVQNEHYERYKQPDKRLQSVFEDDSVFTLWRDTWEYVASELDDLDAVAGYELINEPKRPALADATELNLVDDYLRVIKGIREKDPRHIIFVPEFNSRETNPGEQYWDERKQTFVTDKGEQGTLWGANWLSMPDTITNLVYVAHFYDPYTFTSTTIGGDFDAAELEKSVNNRVKFSYQDQKRPLFISEYGITNFLSLSGQTERKAEYLKTVHEIFDKYHLSSTIWQYKDLITPWVKAKEVFGLWFHYYDNSNIKNVTTGKVIYTDKQVEQASVESGIDFVLNNYFISHDSLISFSSLNNQLVINELNRYFSSSSLALPTKPFVTEPLIRINNKVLTIGNLPEGTVPFPVAIYDTGGNVLYNAMAIPQYNQAYLSLQNIKTEPGTVVIIKAGINGKLIRKVIYN